MFNFKSINGSFALILGASEGLGAAFARHIAAQGVSVVLVARREKELTKLADELRKSYPVSVLSIVQDLVEPDAVKSISIALESLKIGMVVHNAAVSFIGPFQNNAIEDHERLVRVNTLSLLESLHRFGTPMLERQEGAFIIMSSLAGYQGSGYLAAYAASKAFSRILGEGLWYEWQKKGVAIISCCAGATKTPNYVKTQPGKTSNFAPKVQQPEAVVRECFQNLGKRPSVITGRGNRIAHFFMGKLFGTRLAVKIMGDNTRKMYRITD